MLGLYDPVFSMQTQDLHCIGCFAYLHCHWMTGVVLASLRTSDSLGLGTAQKADGTT